MNTSTGVDTLEQNVADEAIEDGTKFQDLTALAKEQIFGFLTPNELQIIRTVCRDWFCIINNKFGIKVVIDNRNTILLSQSPWIVDVVFHSVTLPVPIDGPVFALRLRHLMIKGLVVSYNLIPLVATCVNLQTLVFDDPTFDLPSNIFQTLTPNDLSLPNCESLEVLCWTFSESLTAILIFLAGIQFGCLRRFTFRAVQPPSIPLASLFLPIRPTITDSTNPLMKIIVKNIDGLRLLSFGSMTYQSKFYFIPESYTDGLVRQLDEVHIHNLFMSWLPILQHQNQLRTLFVGHCQSQQWTEIRACITRCAPHLSQLGIQGRTFGLPWDCDVFGECAELEELHIGLALSPKRHINALPLSLTSLEIDGPIEEAELSSLCLLSSLRNLTLVNLGLNLMVFLPGNDDEAEQEPNHDVLRLQLFWSFLINLRNLEELFIKDCAPDALDWVSINSWCQSVATKFSTIEFEILLYDVRGDRIQHGLTLKIPNGFDHTAFHLPDNLENNRNVPQIPQRRGFLGNVLRIFGLGI